MSCIIAFSQSRQIRNCAACAGTAIANIIPNQAERAEINQKTSDLPTFGQVGDALKKNLGQNDPKDIGRAIDRNTPGSSTLVRCLFADCLLLEM